MPVSFDQVPQNLRTPGSYVEFNNELANAASQSFKAFMFGQKLASGGLPAGEPVRITNPLAAKAAFGQGSQLALMVGAFLAANAQTELWVVALDDAAAGNAAACPITITTDATAAGTLNVYFGGERVRIGVAKDEDKATTASNLAAAINANSDLPVTAAVNGTTAHQVDITAKHKGEFMNGFDVRVNYYGEALPEGLTVTTANLTGGTANPDISTAIDAMGDAWFNWLVCPYTDTANLTLLKTELDSRWGALRQIDGRAFTAISGSHAQMGTFGDGHNSPQLSILGTGFSPTPPFVAASINAAVASFSLGIDPARPLQTLVLPGFKAPKVAQQLGQSERNLLLYDGISTFTVDGDGTCRIERQITSYQENSQGLEDASYLNINTPETLSRIRFEQRAMLAQRYPRHKLASDGNNIPPGQAMVTPKVVKGAFLDLCKTVFIPRGWVEDYAQYSETLIVERDNTDRDRINWRDVPNLVNQARVFAGKQQFIL